MAVTEELRVLLKTVADTSGATQTQQALKKTQTEAAAATRLSAQSLIGFGTAALGAWSSAQFLTEALGDSIQVYREHQRVVRATGMAYGTAAAQYIEFAKQLEATTGFTSDAILEAALSARTLSQNYGLTIEQTQKLISVSADLARVRGIGIAEAFERVQSAIRGEAEASEYLGLTLNDTYLQNQAMNGSLKNTYGSLTDVQKAQVRYNELLRQSEQFAGLAAASTDSLDGAFGRAGTSVHNLQLALGELIAPGVIKGLDAITVAVKGITTELQDPRFIELLKILYGGPGQIFGPPNLTPFMNPGPPGSPVGGGGTGGFLGPGDAGVTPRGGTVHYLPPLVITPEQAARERERRRMMVLNEQLLPPVSTEQTQALVALIAKEQAATQQLEAAERDLLVLEQQRADLHLQSAQMAAEEARLRLQMLPAQARMAELQRTITEQQLRARQAALPASRALEDLRYEQQRLQLTLAAKRAAPEERSDIRRNLRELTRAMPGAELDALLAGRGETLAGRASEDLNIQQQLLNLTNDRTLAGIQLDQERNSLLDRILAAQTEAQQKLVDALRQQPVSLTVNFTQPDGSTVIYYDLIEANGQAQTPPTIQQSGVRRGPS